MNIRSVIFSPDVPFFEKATDIFEHQVKENPVYGSFVNSFGIKSEEITALEEMPLLPVRGFRETDLASRSGDPDLIFKSSGTSGMDRSTHMVFDEKLCMDSVTRGFFHFYDHDCIIWAYTPGYAENPHSSLIWMLNTLIKTTGDRRSRFLELDRPLRKDNIARIAAENKTLILFGAAFGLLDLVESSDISLPDNSIVIETGGMKTYQREIDREELHRRLAEGFRLSPEKIHSEYGMCEMLSQAYSREEGWFDTVPWLHITIRDANDPFRVCKPGEEGVIGVIDLANIDSCSFFLTGDKGVGDDQNRFKVLGRWNPLDLRGCNFLIDED